MAWRCSVGAEHRQKSTAERIPVVHPDTGAPVSLDIVAHNAFIAGFEDGVTDAFGWDDYRMGIELGGQDYRDGFASGKQARITMFRDAKKRSDARSGRVTG